MLQIIHKCAGIKFLMMSGDDVDGASKTNTLHLHIGLDDAERDGSDDVMRHHRAVGFINLIQASNCCLGIRG